MTIERIKNTFIWKRALAPIENEPYADKKEELRSAFMKFRENTSFLVSNISRKLPELTQHDISHLDALWEIASLITGENYPINPLEAFVLGGSILLHDSALCIEAYENGETGLRETIEWKDAFSDINEKNPFEDVAILKSQADFIALRQLHAVQAETLIERRWTDPETGQLIYLLENQLLRKHLGKLIGQIAASHHWDIEFISSKLSSQQNSISTFPREWRIDPVKLACILRCADAAHIDNERAPDFLHALIKRHGLSFNHWKAQNKLSNVDIDQSESKKDTLLFTSTIDYSEDEAESWFVAYDAACLVEKEIKSCNFLLEQRINTEPFQVKKVKGVESPEVMSNYIKPINWKPCSAMVHVGNIEKVIQNLGGEMLYGAGSDFLGIVLRELLQNARDSIQARVVFDKDFTGKIHISIKEEKDTFYLVVEDNGIGMSERVLTGSLLDFGTSFWTSNLVRSEFPGLRSSNFKSIGRFGIGFYSVFMIADQVFVASRNWDKGLNEVTEMKFPQGFTLRPILTKGNIDGFSSLTSTKITLKLKPESISANMMVQIKTNREGSKNFNIPFSQYISALSAGLDVSVTFNEFGKDEINVHENIESQNFDKNKWLHAISFSNILTDNRDFISKNIERLKPIIENNKILGLAAINTKLSNQQDFLSITTVGGLAQSVHARDGERFIGYIDYKPKSAKRDIGDYSASKAVIEEWAENQLKELLCLPLNPIERYCASAALSSFNVDPSSLAEILIIKNNRQFFMSFDKIAELSTEMKIAFLEVDYGKHMETHHRIQSIEGLAMVSPLSNSSFLSLKLHNGIPENDNSIFDCTYRAIIKKSWSPVIERIEGIGKNIWGRNINAITIFSMK
jgi:hypothetical protein